MSCPGVRIVVVTVAPVDLDGERLLDRDVVGDLGHRATAEPGDTTPVHQPTHGTTVPHRGSKSAPPFQGTPVWAGWTRPVWVQRRVPSK